MQKQYFHDHYPLGRIANEITDQLPVIARALERIAALLARNNSAEIAHLTAERDEARRANRPLVYLASPYTGDEQARFDAVTKAAGHLVKAGLIVFSPITHFHPIALATALPTGWEFWERLDRAYLSVSSAIYVLTLPGWERSKGVTAEIRIAREMGTPILFVDPEDYSIRADPHPPTTSAGTDADAPQEPPK